VSHRGKTDWYHLNALKALKRNLGMRQAVEIACPEWLDRQVTRTQRNSPNASGSQSEQRKATLRP
jgi:hypothetical protein